MIDRAVLLVDEVFIGGHSQGTTNAGVYPGYVPDDRLVGIGLYGTISDARISAENVVFQGFYADHVVRAQDLVAEGETSARTVIGWDTAFGQQVFRSPRTWLSYYGPDTLAVVEREITKSPVPVLLLGAQGDLFTIGQWSIAVRDAALGAGVDATYTVLPYPDTVFDPDFFGGNAHSFVAGKRCCSGYIGKDEKPEIILTRYKRKSTKIRHFSYPRIELMYRVGLESIPDDIHSLAENA